MKTANRKVDLLYPLTFFEVIVYSMVMYYLSLSIFHSDGLFSLGILMAVPMLVGIVSSTWVGYLFDKHNKKVIFGVSSIVFALPCTALLVGFHYTAPATFSVIRIVSFLVINLVFPINSMLFNTIIPHYFGRNEIAMVNRKISIYATVASIISPVFAGWLFTRYGAGLILLFLEIASIIFMILVLIFANRRAHHATEAGDTDEEGEADDVSLPPIKTLRQLLGNQILLWIPVSLSVLFFGIGSFGALEVPFITKTLNAGSGGYALVLSWSAVASLISSIAYKYINKVLRLEISFVAGIIGICVAWVGFSLSPNFIVALVFVLIAAVSNNTLILSGITLIQQHVNLNQAGRVISIATSMHEVTGSVSYLLWPSLATLFHIPLRTVILTASLVASLSIIPAALASRKWNRSEDTYNDGA